MFGFSARDYFNTNAVAQITRAKEILGLRSDGDALVYAIALLEAAGKAKEVGGQLVICKDEGQGLKPFYALTLKPETVAIESTGDHKGEIYGGIYPADNKPIWFLAAPKAMDHHAAAAWAEGQGSSLPTRKQGDYLTTLKDKGALKDIFSRHSGSSSTAGSFWLAEHDDILARTQQFSDGSQSAELRHYHLPVLSVRR